MPLREVKQAKVKVQSFRGEIPVYIIPAALCGDLPKQLFSEKEVSGKWLIFNVHGFVFKKMYSGKVAVDALFEGAHNDLSDRQGLVDAHNRQRGSSDMSAYTPRVMNCAEEARFLQAPEDSLQRETSSAELPHVSAEKEEAPVRSHYAPAMWGAGILGVLGAATGAVAVERFLAMQARQRTLDVALRKMKATPEQLSCLRKRRNVARDWAIGSGVVSTLSLLLAVLAVRSGWRSGAFKAPLAI